ncbi:hypothetical protein V5F49_15675 [Xanthobacter sp. V3C-3]|uniref:hypothetical protein n=1 Tax=Xanthobacter lutulentifluminis TaxID=3119935 RepID=UPI00372908AC
MSAVGGGGGEGGGAAGRWRLRARPSAAGVALLALGILAAAGTAPAQAQLSPMQSLGELPALPPIDPDVDPYPFDPFLILRTYLRDRLPAGWWARDPVFGAGVFSVVVNIPESWKGNPTSAMLRLCPEPRSKLWDRISVIELRPFYRKSPWAPAVCRR